MTSVGPLELTEAELTAWGQTIGREIQRPVFFALYGELGAGKSVLARAIARGAGVEGPMPSPTFNLVYTYTTEDGTEVWHLDLYRIQSADEVWDLSWDDLGTQNDIVLVEWPERADAYLPPDRWEIRLDLLDDDGAMSDQRRRVTATRVGSAPTLPQREGR